MVAPNVVQTDSNNYDIKLANGENVHIGNPVMTSGFSPTLTFPRWGECSIKLQMVGANALFTSSVVQTNSVTVQNSYFILTHTGVDVNPPFNDGGGLDFIITLLQAPPSNIISFGVTSSNIRALFQPSLKTQFTVGQTLRNGSLAAIVTDTDVINSSGNIVVHRPIHVVNSIAIYHSTKGKLVLSEEASKGITTGKIGHLYAMLCTDANNNTAYAGWNLISQALYQLVIPAAFLSSAVYPLTITSIGDAFGYTSIGGAVDTLSSRFEGYGSGYSPAANGQAVSMSFYGKEYTAGTTANVQLGLYTKTGSNFVNNTPTILVNSATPQWWTGTFPSGSAVTAGTSYYTFWEEQVFDTAYYYYDTNLAYTGVYYSTSWVYGTWPTPITISVDVDNEEISMYVTYLPSKDPTVFGSGTATPAVIGTEYDFSDPNVQGTFILIIDTNALAAGDVLEIRAYKMTLTGGTSRVLYETAYYGAQPADDVIKITPAIPNDLTDSNAIRFTYNQTFGTARAIPWKVYWYGHTPLGMINLLPFIY